MRCCRWRILGRDGPIYYANPKISPMRCFLHHERHIIQPWFLLFPFAQNRNQSSGLFSLFTDFHHHSGTESLFLLERLQRTQLIFKVARVVCPVDKAQWSPPCNNLVYDPRQPKDVRIPKFPSLSTTDLWRLSFMSISSVPSLNLWFVCN